MEDYRKYVFEERVSLANVEESLSGSCSEKDLGLMLDETESSLIRLRRIRDTLCSVESLIHSKEMVLNDIRRRKNTPLVLNAYTLAKERGWVLRRQVHGYDGSVTVYQTKDPEDKNDECSKEDILSTYLKYDGSLHPLYRTLYLQGGGRYYTVR